MRAVNLFYFYIGTFFGLGLVPFAPGTFGTLGGLACVALYYPSGVVGQLVLLILITLIGVKAADYIIKTKNDPDPSQVVIDEVAGIFATFLGFSSLSPAQLITGFVLFRILDILKPGPIAQLETISGGVGVMADDIAAGLIACICMHIIFGGLL